MLFYERKVNRQRQKTVKARPYNMADQTGPCATWPVPMFIDLAISRTHCPRRTLARCISLSRAPSRLGPARSHTTVHGACLCWCACDRANFLLSVHFTPFCSYVFNLQRNLSLAVHIHVSRLPTPFSWCRRRGSSCRACACVRSCVSSLVGKSVVRARPISPIPIPATVRLVLPALYSRNCPFVSVFFLPFFRFSRFPPRTHIHAHIHTHISAPLGRSACPRLSGVCVCTCDSM